MRIPVSIIYIWNLRVIPFLIKGLAVILFSSLLYLIACQRADDQKIISFNETCYSINKYHINDTVNRKNDPLINFDIYRDSLIVMQFFKNQHELLFYKLHNLSNTVGYLNTIRLDTIVDFIYCDLGLLVLTPHELRWYKNNKASIYDVTNLPYNVYHNIHETRQKIYLMGSNRTDYFEKPEASLNKKSFSILEGKKCKDKLTYNSIQNNLDVRNECNNDIKSYSIVDFYGKVNGMLRLGNDSDDSYHLIQLILRDEKNGDEAASNKEMLSINLAKALDEGKNARQVYWEAIDMYKIFELQDPMTRINYRIKNQNVYAVNFNFNHFQLAKISRDFLSSDVASGIFDLTLKNIKFVNFDSLTQSEKTLRLSILHLIQNEINTNNYLKDPESFISYIPDSLEIACIKDEALKNKLLLDLEKQLVSILKKYKPYDDKINNTQTGVLKIAEDYLTFEWQFKANYNVPENCKDSLGPCWVLPFDLIHLKDEKVVGVPYCYGGKMSLNEFAQKVNECVAPGNTCGPECCPQWSDMKRYCLNNLTCGIDCSGLIVRSFSIDEKNAPEELGTYQIYEAGKLFKNMGSNYTEIKKGDILIRPGKHIGICYERKDDYIKIIHAGTQSFFNVANNSTLIRGMHEGMRVDSAPIYYIDRLLGEWKSAKYEILKFVNPDKTGESYLSFYNYLTQVIEKTVEQHNSTKTLLIENTSMN